MVIYCRANNEYLPYKVIYGQRSPVLLSPDLITFMRRDSIKIEILLHICPVNIMEEYFLYTNNLPLAIREIRDHGGVVIETLQGTALIVLIGKNVIERLEFSTLEPNTKIDRAVEISKRVWLRRQNSKSATPNDLQWNAMGFTPPAKPTYD